MVTQEIVTRLGYPVVNTQARASSRAQPGDGPALYTSDCLIYESQPAILP